jgi:myo-inositol 2-dehydrogenase/D-chiro-inositol 1-dehydrogenase
MPAAPTRICLIGLGRAGMFHLQSLRMMEEAKLSCVYDIDSARADAVARQYDCIAATSVEEAIDRSKVDAVIVATPTDAHFEYVERCLDAQLPVLSEKPLGRKLWHIDACFEKAKASSTPLFVAFQRRFDPSFGALVQGVHAGDIGQLQFVRCVARDNPVPLLDYIRVSGGIFHDCMVHDLDMVSTIVREVPTHMSAFGSSFIKAVGELGDFDSAVAMLSFPSGVTATIDINRKSAYGYDQRIESFGDRGMLQADNHHTTTVARATQEGFLRSPVDDSFPTRYREAYLAELRCFVRCARGEEEVPISHADVRTNHLLATGLEIAARQQRVVRFDEIEPGLSPES